MLRFRPLLAFALALSLSGLAAAETFTHKDAKVSFDAPDKWKTKAEDSTLTLTSPDDGCSIVFIVLPGDKLEEALMEAGKRIEAEVKDLEPDGEPQELTINGMKAFMADAKGKVDGKAVDVGFGVVETMTDKALLIFGVADASKDYGDEIAAVIKSLKPIKD